jgi:hypothetical protein
LLKNKMKIIVDFVLVLSKVESKIYPDIHLN